ncbi:MAG: Crp/Fnr family transcriptional regulator [Bacteroidetes bacterium]|nr:MAG: Crp/Fnr family transcriptional regulator [Bacteroidota bacterium]
MTKILLIEDNPEMRENTSEILALAGYDVKTAPNGKAGVELAQQETPDIIICDIMMPMLDGYGVLHLLGKKPETAGIPFIFLTAKAERNDFRKGMEMGADDYLTKPFEESELLNAISSRLKKAEMFNRNYPRTLDGVHQFIQNARGLDDLKKLQEKHDVIPVPKKNTVYHEGAYPKGVYFLVKGKIKGFKSSEIGKEYITSLYKEGDFFGYTALLEETTYTDSAEALEPSEVCLIPKDDFFSLLHGNNNVSQAFIRLLSNELAEKEEQLVRLAYNTVRLRVSEALVKLAERYSDSNQKDFSMNISRENLAGIVGTSTETVIRTLSDFKDEKLVDMKGSTITILDLERLKKLKY